ncbi:hypothetical protein QJS10_CPB17g02338 [Acorus calamus]|uniref:Uncharacterized protein n=1 Tax=Acorus calamus TaxID=4465 RepID=A0AAV9CTG4_ACOCL|nr:hypothetical protein QJS10_CPB17g02338 [Acorus calamus]
MIGTTTTTDGDDELQRRYNHLQHDWDSYKKSKSTTTPTPSDIEHLMNISPGDLMSSLQSLSSSDSTVMMMEEEKEKDVVVEDPRIQRIVRQRKAVIASGELKARRLLEALDQEETG